jgi:hypothetical protein
MKRYKGKNNSSPKRNNSPRKNQHPEMKRKGKNCPKNQS